jgi:hypothetical protein
VFPHVRDRRNVMQLIECEKGHRGSRWAQRPLARPAVRKRTGGLPGALCSLLLRV